MLPTLMWITCTIHTVAEPPRPGVEAPASGTRKNERRLIKTLSSPGRYFGFSTSPMASLSPRLSASSVACMCACVCCARIACIACTFCPPGRPLAAARWASRHQHEAGQAGRAGRPILSKQTTEGVSRLLRDAPQEAVRQAGGDLDVHVRRRTLPKLAQELRRNVRVDLVEGDRCGAGPFQPRHDVTREPCPQRTLVVLEGVLRIHAHIQGRDRERAERRGIWRRHRGALSCAICALT